MSTSQFEALSLADEVDEVAKTYPGMAEVSSALRRLHAENASLKAGYDAARLEIDHLRGATKTVEPAHPVAWLVYLPSIDTQRVYDDQDDPGYLDDLTNHADAEVIPLYPGTARKAEVAPAGEYPSLPAKQALYVFRGKDGGREEVHGYDELQMWGFVDADRAMRAQAAPAARRDMTDEDMDTLVTLLGQHERDEIGHQGLVEAIVREFGRITCAGSEAPHAKETAMASRRSRNRRDKRQPIPDFTDPR